MMKKVLILCFLHPFVPMGGSFRVLPLARNLPRFGWEPTVLTPALEQKADLPFRVVETGYKDALAFWKKLFGLNVNTDVRVQLNERGTSDSSNRLLDFLLTRMGELLNYPDSFRGWKPYAVKAADTLLKNESFDAVMTCHPTMSHIIGAGIKSTYGLPWVADFPDLWSQNHNYHYNGVRHYFDTCLERKTLRHADVLTTVSEPWAEKLRSLHKDKQAYGITHGFDDAEVNRPPVQVTGPFTITYTGKVYKERQDPSKLFEALASLISVGEIVRETVEVRFFGDTSIWLKETAARYGISDIVRFHPAVPREESVRNQKESQVLLLLNWNDAAEQGVYPGKIFEYLAARRPVLAIDGSPDEVERLLGKTKAGISAHTLEAVKETLSGLYGEYRENGEVRYNGVDQEINKYSHREMANKFAEIFNSISGNE